VKVVYATPNFHQNRGNTVTVKRIANGIEQLGVQTEIVSFTEENSQTFFPEADLIHGFNAYLFYQFIRTIALKSFIITLTGTDLNHHFKNPKSRKDVISCMQEAKAIHVFNEEAKNIILNELPDLAEKIIVIAQGISTLTEVNPLVSSKKEPGTFLFVLPAGIRKVKNIFFALEEVYQLYSKYPHVRLWLVGPVLEEEEGRQIEEFVHFHKEWVQYLGEVPHEAMSSIYQQADCVLNTSHSEGQPSTVIEAMAHSIAVLVSNNHGNTSIVSHLETGLIYSSREEFITFAELLISDKERREQLGYYAKEYVAKNHSSEKEAEQFLNLYEAVFKQNQCLDTNI
jgi:glycosyltransferase involved in cell wall biosynthesis